jgi:hypothetical protein
MGGDRQEVVDGHSFGSPKRQRGAQAETDRHDKVELAGQTDACYTSVHAPAPPGGSLGAFGQICR